MGRVGKALRKPMGNTYGEAVGMSLATGVAVGTTNNTINKNYIKRGRQAYYQRRLKNGQVIKVRKAQNHGIGWAQSKRK